MNSPLRSSQEADYSDYGAFSGYEDLNDEVEDEEIREEFVDGDGAEGSERPGFEVDESETEFDDEEKRAEVGKDDYQEEYYEDDGVERNGADSNSLFLSRESESESATCLESNRVISRQSSQVREGATSRPNRRNREERLRNRYDETASFSRSSRASSTAEASTPASSASSRQRVEGMKNSQSLEADLKSVIDLVRCKEADLKDGMKNHRKVIGQIASGFLQAMEKGHESMMGRMVPQINERVKRLTLKLEKIRNLEEELREFHSIAGSLLEEEI